MQKSGSQNSPIYLQQSSLPQRSLRELEGEFFSSLVLSGMCLLLMGCVWIIEKEIFESKLLYGDYLQLLLFSGVVLFPVFGQKRAKEAREFAVVIEQVRKKAEPYQKHADEYSKTADDLRQRAEREYEKGNTVGYEDLYIQADTADEEADEWQKKADRYTNQADDMQYGKEFMDAARETVRKKTLKDLKKMKVQPAMNGGLSKTPDKQSEPVYKDFSFGVMLWIFVIVPASLVVSSFGDFYFLIGFQGFIYAKWVAVQPGSEFAGMYMMMAILPQALGIGLNFWAVYCLRSILKNPPKRSIVVDVLLWQAIIMLLTGIYLNFVYPIFLKLKYY